MLACLGRRAEEEGWIAVNVTSSEGMLEDVIQQQGDALLDLRINFIEKGKSWRVPVVRSAGVRI